MMHNEKSSESIKKGIMCKMHGVELIEIIKRAEYIEELIDMKGLFGLDRLTGEDIEEILRTGDIFASAKKKNKVIA